MEAKRLAPGDPTVSAALADLSHFIGGRQDRAIAGYKEILQSEAGGGDATTLMKLGMSYLMANRFDLAQQSFDKILEADPDNVQALAFRSTTYTHDKQFDRALSDLNRAVALAPDKVEVRQWRGEVLLYAGEFKKAIDDFNISLRARPKSPFYRMRGVAEYMTGDYAAAQDDFTRDLDFDPVYAHLAAWRFFAAKRSGGDGTTPLTEIVTALDGRWPTPLLKFVLGQVTISDVIAAVASTNNPTLRQVRESQARSAIGEWLLLNGERAAAAEHFKVSNDLGIVVSMDEVKERRTVFPPETLIEFAVARARLKESVQ
jgi:lipoprotein NlpI